MEWKIKYRRNGNRGESRKFSRYTRMWKFCTTRSGKRNSENSSACRKSISTIGMDRSSSIHSEKRDEEKFHASSVSSSAVKVNKRWWRETQSRHLLAWKREKEKEKRKQSPFDFQNKIGKKKNVCIYIYNNNNNTSIKWNKNSVIA